MSLFDKLDFIRKQRTRIAIVKENLVTRGTNSRIIPMRSIRIKCKSTVKKQRRRYLLQMTVMFDVFPTSGQHSLLSAWIYLLENLHAALCYT